MKKSIGVLFLFLGVLLFTSCANESNNEEGKTEQVNDMLEKSNQKADSLKKTLGIE